jgi:hypothetical protein
MFDYELGSSQRGEHLAAHSLKGQFHEKVCEIMT